MDAKNTGYNASETERMLNRGRVYHTACTSVHWGGYSQINAELLLLDMSARIQEGGYAYYHLLSGQDLPLKSQDDIHDFFDRNDGKEFVSCVLKREGEPFEWMRVRFYNLSDIVNYNATWGRALNRLFWKTQQYLHIERNMDINFRMGPSWWSITDAFAKYILSMEDWIKKVFKGAANGDEVFVQTLLVNSGFAANQYHNGAAGANMRLIDWERGGRKNPYIFRAQDLGTLKESDMMFARKFDAAVDSEIIKRVADEFGHI